MEKATRIKIAKYSELDLVGDYYALVRNSIKLWPRVKWCIDKRCFLEGIGLVYMRLADEIDACDLNLCRYLNNKHQPNELVGRKLERLKQNNVINEKVYSDTRAFMDIRNDVIHKRWDGTIKKFRKVCNLGMHLEAFFSNINYDFSVYDDHKRNRTPSKTKLVLVDKDGKITIAVYKPNKMLFELLKDLSNKSR